MITTDTQAIEVTARRFWLPYGDETRIEAGDTRLPLAVVRYLRRNNRLADKQDIIRAAIGRCQETEHAA